MKWIALILFAGLLIQAFGDLIFGGGRDKKNNGDVRSGWDT